MLQILVKLINSTFSNQPFQCFQLYRLKLRVKFNTKTRTKEISVRDAWENTRRKTETSLCPYKRFIREKK